MMTEVQGADATFDFFKDLPKDESTREELAAFKKDWTAAGGLIWASTCLLYTSPSPRDVEESRMPSSA